MNEVIHNSLEEAHEACCEYCERIEELEKKLGIEVCVGSAMTLIYAKYRNPLTGNIENYRYY